MLITRCLAKQPERRFQSASDLAFTLRTICSRAAESKSPLPVREHDNLPAPASRPVNRPSVAVLPLQNFSPNKLETEFLVDGMTDALIAELAKLRGLRVVSRTSVMQYKETRKLLREIAQELGADAVVEGSVLYAAPHVRITAQLIRAETEDYLWVESYQQELRDILALQSEVARTVAREVSLKLAQELPGENHHA
jgi:TolB-like protein